MTGPSPMTGPSLVARAVVAALALAALGASASAQQDSFEKIQKEFDQLYRKGGAKGPDVSRLTELIDRALDVAIDHKGEPIGFDVYSFALDWIRPLDAEKQVAVFTEAMDGVIESYLDDDRLVTLVMGDTLGYPAEHVKDKAAEYLEWIERDSKSPSVRCAFAFKKRADLAMRSIDPQECRKIAAEFEELKKVYGDAPGPFGQKWSDMLDSEIEGLMLVGTPAKEVVGQDLDGVEFKLSDYRGKAVLFD